MSDKATLPTDFH